jgi:hypothetical protein
MRSGGPLAIERKKRRKIGISLRWTASEMKIDLKSEVTATELAALWGVTRKRVEQLANDGVAIRLEKGRYQLIESNRRYLAMVVERQAKKATAAAEYQQMRSADLSLRMAERKGTLIADAEQAALAVADHVLGELRADIYSIPARVTQDQGLRSAIERGLDDAFRGASDRAARCADGRPLGSDAVAAEGTNDAGRMGAGEPRISRKRRRAGST